MGRYLSPEKSIIVDPITGVEANVEQNGGLAVNIQDQHTPVLIVPLNQTENTTTLTAPTTITDGPGAVISVTSATGFAAGKFVSLANIAEDRYYTAEVVSVAVLDVTLDTPIDFAYPVSGTVVTQGTSNLNVNGSVTAQKFSLRASDPGLPVVIDITRIIMKMTTAAAVDLSKFGDIVGGITNGITFRRTDGTYSNIGSALKTNGDIAGVMYDWTPYEKTNPAQGIDGFVCRMTFAGQNKMGVTVRVGPDEDFEILIQDNLTSITSFKIIVEGHVVTD